MTAHRDCAAFSHLAERDGLVVGHMACAFGAGLAQSVFLIGWNIAQAGFAANMMRARWRLGQMLAAVGAKRGGSKSRPATLKDLSDAAQSPA
jgi:Na+/melibiose symporter-like transporter